MSAVDQNLVLHISGDRLIISMDIKLKHVNFTSLFCQCMSKVMNILLVTYYDNLVKLVYILDII